MDFFRIIPPALELVEKTIAIFAISYLFYHASLSKILLGHKRKVFDFWIVTSFLFLSIKSFIGFLIAASEEQSIISWFFELVVSNAHLIEKAGFHIGVFLLFIISMVMTGEKVRRPSFLYIIHEEKRPNSIPKKIIHLLIIYLALIAFYTLVFTFSIEWLGTTVDAPVLVLVLLFFLTLISKHRARINHKLLVSINEASEHFYEQIILMFQKKSRILIAIVGILVLHIVVEVGHFIIPYTTGLAVPWYFPMLGPGHEPLAARMLADFALATSKIQQFFIMLVYIINVLAALMLFLTPAYIWYYLYKDKKIYPGHLTWLFFGALTVFMIAPVFKMKPLASVLLLGTDIMTQQIPFVENVFYAVFAGLIISAIFFVLYKLYPKRTSKVAFFAALLYFAFYLMHFFIDLWNYYTRSTILLFENLQIVLGMHFFIFFILTILFYIGSYTILIYEVLAKQKM